MRWSSVVALAILLVLASFSLDVAVPSGPNTSPCCSSHTTSRLRRHVLKSFFYTSAKCPLQSVVFIFNKGYQICADPKAKWVKDLLEYLTKE